MKKLICIILSIFLAITLAACMSEGEYLEADIQKLREQKNNLTSEVNALEAEKSQLQKDIVDFRVENGVAKYVLTINIKQTHFTLDLSQHLKDSMNDISIQVPVDKEYYDSVDIGDVLDDSFRMGSFIFKGSWGNWKVTVQNKTIM